MNIRPGREAWDLYELATTYWEKAAEAHYMDNPHRERRCVQASRLANRMASRLEAEDEERQLIDALHLVEEPTYHFDNIPF